MLAAAGAGVVTRGGHLLTPLGFAVVALISAAIGIAIGWMLPL